MGKKRYVEPEDLKREIKLSQEQGKLTPMAVTMLLKILDHVQRPFKYVYEHDKEDCRSSVIEKLLNKWNRYDETKGDIFSFYTQMIKFDLYAAWNDIKKHRADFSTSNIFTDEV